MAVRTTIPVLNIYCVLKADSEQAGDGQQTREHVAQLKHQLLIQPFHIDDGLWWLGRNNEPVAESLSGLAQQSTKGVIEPVLFILLAVELTQMVLPLFDAPVHLCGRWDHVLSW